MAARGGRRGGEEKDRERESRVKNKSASQKARWPSPLHRLSRLPLSLSSFFSSASHSVLLFFYFSISHIYADERYSPERKGTRMRKSKHLPR
jgi:hypothetical protein